MYSARIFKLTNLKLILSALFFFTISIAQEIHVSGQVWGLSDGLPVPVSGAAIVVEGIDHQTQSDANGFYEISFHWNWNGPVFITCSAPGYDSAQEVFFPESPDVIMDFYLQFQPPPLIFFFEGTVQGQAGLMLPAYFPLEGAHVEIIGENDPNDVNYLDTVTDANGYFVFYVPDDLSLFPLNQEALVRVSAEGYETQEIWFDFHNWPIVEDFYLDLAVPAEALLFGHVYNGGYSDPTPLPGAHVMIYGGFTGGLLAETYTDDTGYYEFGDVAMAADAIEINAPGFIPQEHPLPGYGGEYPMELDFALMPEFDPGDTGWVFGTVSGQNTPMGPVFPIAGAVIGATPAWGPEPWPSTETDENGEYALELPAMEIPWIVYCETELGTQVEVVTVMPGSEIQINFHFNAWEPPQIPAPFGLTAEFDPAIGENGGVILNWHYPPVPDPTLVPTFRIFAETPIGGWEIIGTTDDNHFVAELPELPPGAEPCFAVSAVFLEMESELSNTACISVLPQECMDLSGIDFGECDMVLGIGWNGSECTWFSGCDWVVDGVDYSPYFFDTMDECTAACEDHPGDGVIFGTVNYIWGDAIELVEDAHIQATHADEPQVYETFTNQFGEYELHLPHGEYTVTCTLPNGESQVENLFVPAGEPVQLDFWFGEFQNQFALTGTVSGMTPSGQAVPLDDAHVVVHLGDFVDDAWTTEGHYWIDLPEPETYTVFVEAEGYIDAEMTVTVDGITEQNFVLEPLDGYMNPVRIIVGNAVGIPGDQVEVPIFVETEHPVSGIQFTLVDDPDLLYAVDYVSEFDCFSASHNEVDGAVITIFFSPDGCMLEPGSYPFATLVYEMNDAPPGSIVSLFPTDGVISDPDGNPLEFELIPGEVSVGLPGDINMDGEVNVLDIVQLVNFILLIENPTDYQFFTGDLNQDGALNVLDVVRLVNLILYPGEGRSTGDFGSAAEVRTGDGLIFIVGTGIAGFQITADRDISVNGWDLPSGWTVVTHNNRLLAYSMGDELNGRGEIRISGDISIAEMLFSDGSGNNVPVTQTHLPEKIRLLSAYPNPFNPVTTLTYELPEDGMVKMEIYDVQGRQVNALVNGYESAGVHQVVWDANGLPSGSYFVQLKSGGMTVTQKVLLVK